MKSNWRELLEQIWAEDRADEMGEEGDENEEDNDEDADHIYSHKGPPERNITPAGKNETH